MLEHKLRKKITPKQMEWAEYGALFTQYDGNGDEKLPPTRISYSKHHDAYFEIVKQVKTYGGVFPPEREIKAYYNNEGKLILKKISNVCFNKYDKIITYHYNEDNKVEELVSYFKKEK